MNQYLLRKTKWRANRAMKNKQEGRLDALFSRYIRARAEYKCEFCGKQHLPNSQGLHCSHFIGRRYRTTRWEPDNASSLCFTCHNMMHDFASIHRDFFVKRLGSERVENLEMIARIRSKPDKDEIEAKLEERLKALEL